MTYEERPNGMMIGDRGYTVRGRMLQLGEDAPNFTLDNKSFRPRTLKDYAGKVKLISVVPSLPTAVCSAQTHRFNKEAANLGDDIVILTVSADLPLAQRTWCAAEGVDKVETLSTHRDMKFADDYGVHNVDWRITQRSIFVVDRDDKIVHTEYMLVMGEEVNFEAALEAAKAAAQE